MEDFFSSTAFEFAEVTRTRDNGESSTLGLEPNYYDDNKSKDCKRDSHI